MVYIALALVSLVVPVATTSIDAAGRYSFVSIGDWGGHALQEETYAKNTEQVSIYPQKHHHYSHRIHYLYTTPHIPSKFPHTYIPHIHMHVPPPMRHTLFRFVC